ncbi:MAG: hypothetical protein ACLVJH_17030 [Faecalibacterium prausnitzii]
MFVTELTVNPASHQFLTEDGCERYSQAQQGSTAGSPQGRFAAQELAAEQRRHGGV